MNKFLLMTAATILSTSSFAGVIADGYDEAKLKSNMEYITERLTEAREFIMEKNYFSDGFGDIIAAISELENIIVPDSEQAQKLKELRTAIEEKGFTDSDKQGVIDDARDFFEEIEKPLKDLTEEVNQELESKKTEEADKKPTSEEPVQVVDGEKPAEEAASASDAPAPEAVEEKLAEESVSTPAAEEEKPAEESAPVADGEQPSE